MKHVVTAAPLRQSLLVTGFGAFPGAPANPTATMLRHLEGHRSRLERLGIRLRCALIPVVYAEIAPALAQAVAAHRPDAILHLGLASRRTHLSVETRAINRAGPLHQDARACLPASQILRPGGPGRLSATYPAARILVAIRRQGLATRLSNDAGDYVCNATLYLSLLTGAAPQVGFLHVPRIRNPTQPKARAKGAKPRKPTIEALTRAALAAILVMARRRAPSLAPAASSPRGPRRGGAPEARSRH